MASNDNNSDVLIDELAGEYVLGTLEPSEVATVEARLQREPALAASIEAWRVRLAPLDNAVMPVEPPQGQLDQILTKIDAASGVSQEGIPGGAPSAEIIRLKQRASRWRIATLATGAIAAALALFMVFVDVPSGNISGGPQMVALLESPDSKLAYVASINMQSGKVSLMRVGAGAEAGKSHELWAIGGGRDKPESLGVINARAEISLDRVGLATPEYLKGITLAVSLEPSGGSPTGQPTGPVLFTGKCIELPEV